MAATKFVGRFVASNVMMAPFKKPFPITCSGNDGLPVVIVAGVSSVSEGAAAATRNVMGPAVPPPGPGVVTVTGMLAIAAMSVELTEIDNCVFDMNVVVLDTPFHLTTDDAIKFVPVTVSVNPAPPANAFVGEIEVKLGTGLFGVTTVNGNLFTDGVCPPAGIPTQQARISNHTIALLFIRFLSNSDTFR